MTMPMQFQHYLTCMAVGHVIHYTQRPALHNYYQHLACGRLHSRECHLIAFTTDPFRFVDFIKGNVEEYLDHEAELLIADHCKTKSRNLGRTIERDDPVVKDHCELVTKTFSSVIDIRLPM